MLGPVVVSVSVGPVVVCVGPAVISVIAAWVYSITLDHHIPVVHTSTYYTHILCIMACDVHRRVSLRYFQLTLSLNYFI